MPRGVICAVLLVAAGACAQVASTQVGTTQPALPALAETSELRTGLADALDTTRRELWLYQVPVQVDLHDILAQRFCETVVRRVAQHAFGPEHGAVSFSRYGMGKLDVWVDIGGAKVTAPEIGRALGAILQPEPSVHVFTSKNAMARALWINDSSVMHAVDPVSYHELDPTLLNDGKLKYTETWIRVIRLLNDKVGALPGDGQTKDETERVYTVEVPWRPVPPTRFWQRLRYQVWEKATVIMRWDDDESLLEFRVEPVLKWRFRLGETWHQETTLSLPPEDLWGPKYRLAVNGRLDYEISRLLRRLVFNRPVPEEDD